MLAEFNQFGDPAAPGAAHSKKWDVTKHEGFLEWKVCVDAIIAADAKASNFRDVEAVTPAKVAAVMPGFNALSPADKQQILGQFTTAHEEAVNGLYARVLRTIDLANDHTLLRKIDFEYAPTSTRPTPCPRPRPPSSPTPWSPRSSARA